MSTIIMLLLWNCQTWTVSSKLRIMNPDGQTEFRSAVGKHTALAHTSRPDVCFDVKTMASKLGKATKKDL